MRATSSQPGLWVLGSFTGTDTKCGSGSISWLQYKFIMSLWELPALEPKFPHLAMAKMSGVHTHSKDSGGLSGKLELLIAFPGSKAQLA